MENQSSSSSNTNTILIVVVLVILVAFGVWWFTSARMGAPVEDDNSLNIDVDFPGGASSSGSN